MAQAPAEGTQAQNHAYASAVKAGVPPDPALCGPLCVEVDHCQLLTLRRDDAGRAVLRNSCTGEEHRFEDGVEATLHFHKKRGFVSVGGVQTTWASKLLKASVWECAADKRRFVYRKHADGHDVHWQSELQQQYTAGRLCYRVQGREFACSALHFAHGRPEGPCAVFWDMETVKSALCLRGLSADSLRVWVSNGFSKSWAKLLLKCGCTTADELAMVDSKGASSSTSSGEVVVTRHTISTRALLFCLAHWCKTLKHEADKDSAASFGQGLVEHTCGTAHCRLQNAQVPALARAKGVQALDLPMSGGMVDVSELKTCPWWKSLPSPTRSQAAFLKQDQVSVMVFIVFLSRYACMLDYFAAVVGALSHLVELGAANLIAAGVSILDAVEGRPYCRKDPELRRQVRRQLLMANIGKSYKHVGKLATAMGKKVSLGSRHNHIDCFRYWLASQRALAGEHLIAMCADGSRFGGKERLMSAVMGLGCGVVCWAPPQDIRAEIGTCF